MNSLARRIFAFAGASMLVLIIVSVSFTILRRALDADLLAGNEVLSAQRLWDHSVEQEATRIRKAVLEARMIQRSMGDHSASGKPGGMDLGQQGIHALTYYDELGHATATWPSDAKPVTVDNRLISQILSGGGEFQQLRISDGEASLIVGGDLNAASPGDQVTAAGTGNNEAAFVASASVNDILTDFFQSSGTEGFLLDRKGSPMASDGAIIWQTVASSFSSRHDDVLNMDIGGQTMRMVVINLRDSERQLIGYVCVMRDITVPTRLLDVVDSISLASLLAVLLVIGLSYRWILAGALKHLATAIATMTALAEGDTSVEVIGAGRADEIGQMARAVKVFRDRMRRLRNTDERRLRQLVRQQEFIRVQMVQLAETLPDEGRKAFMEDLDSIEAAAEDSSGGEGSARSLAVAVEVMAARVREQHRRLDSLVHELKAALDTKTELFQLQQQVEVARRMQGAMLPRGIRPQSGFEVSGLLNYAENFDGGFYDFFLTESGELAVTIGQPAEGGLAAGFASATARTSLRALVAAGMAPGESLGRTAALLAGDGAARGFALAAFTIDSQAHSLHWASAGIDAPFLVRRLGDAVDLPVASEPPLAGDPGRQFQEQKVDLPPRSALLLVSPGVMENPSTPGTPLPRERFHAALRDAEDTSPAGLLEALRKEGLTTAMGLPMSRDKLCVALRLAA